MSHQTTLDCGMGRRESSRIHAHPHTHRNLESGCAGLHGRFRASLPHQIWTRSVQDDVAVMLVDLSAWSPWLDQASLLLDAAESARVRRMRQPRQRGQLTLAYALHRLALAEAMAVQPAEVTLHRDHLGRPWLSDRRLQTSLSHGGEMLALAISASGSVGIDIELISRSAEMLEIEPLVCHPDEHRLLEGPAMARGRQLLELWVRKEAMLKAVGVGLARTMAGFAAPVDTPLMLHRNSGKRTTVCMLDAGPHAVAAVALPESAALVTHWLRPQEKIPRPD